MANLSNGGSRDPGMGVRGLGGWSHGVEPFNAHGRMWFLTQNANRACCVALQKRIRHVSIKFPTEFGGGRGISHKICAGVARGRSQAFLGVPLA